MSLRLLIKQFGLLTLALLVSFQVVSASEEHAKEDESFNPSEFILDHIKDSHEWHVITKEDGHHVSIPLPIIVYSKNSGLNAFMSTKLAHGHIYKGFQIQHEGPYAGKIIEVGEDFHAEHQQAKEEHAHEDHAVEASEAHTEESDHQAHSEDEVYLPLDFSITKNVAMMFLAALIMLVLFLSVARAYKKQGISEPRGLQGFIEPIILFVQNDIAIPNIGEDKHHKFMPYLLTVFFFIFLNNIMGLIPFPPFGANVTGNIAVTFVLAFITFLITQFSGNKNYWRHIFATPGVPLWLLPIMIPVEIIGMISKPFALMVRLFANITAGHIIVLSLVSLIFIFKAMWVSAVSVPFTLFMDVLELLVAFIQAYVFTLLSALFIGLAVVDDHH